MMGSLAENFERKNLFKKGDKIQRLDGNSYGFWDKKKFTLIYFNRVLQQSRHVSGKIHLFQLSMALIVFVQARLILLLAFDSRDPCQTFQVFSTLYMEQW